MVEPDGNDLGVLTVLTTSETRNSGYKARPLLVYKDKKIKIATVMNKKVCDVCLF